MNPSTLLAACALLSCGPPSLKIALEPENNSGQSGTATLIEETGGLHVIVRVTAPLFPGPQQLHIHWGRCGEIREHVLDLNRLDNLDGGFMTSDTPPRPTIQMKIPTLADFMDHDHALNVHDSRDKTLYTACGNID